MSEVTPANVKSRLGHVFNRHTRCLNFMFAFCVLFGLAMIANVQVTNDGGWLWYPLALHNGHRLYADLHLALQPLFVLESASILAMFGKGWLVSKIPAVLHVVGFSLSLYLLARRSNLRDGQKAVVLGAAFFVAICSVAYRFDDYHTPADCLDLFSLAVLLMLREAKGLRRALGLVLALGVLSGLAVTLRINDGVALCFGVAISIFCLAPTKRFLATVLFVLTTALVVVGVVRLTGDTFHDYAMYSIFKATSGKGGTGNVLVYPLELPWHSIVFLKHRWYPELIVYTFGAAAVWSYLLRPLKQSREPKRLIGAVAGCLLLLVGFLHVYHGFFDPDLVMAMSPVAIITMYVLGIFVFVRYLLWEISGRSNGWDSREILLITPLGQLISTAASSGGVPWGVYEPWAMLVIVLPISSPIRLKSESMRAVLIAVGAILVVYGAIYRFKEPYIWHSARAEMMFTGRQWYRHPIYGPMIIQTNTLQFMQPICNELASEGPEGELLSLPYPYANYFCGIAPWHGHVQTYFDTSTPDTIFGLMGELQKSPPKWILYERQLGSLAAHEKQYNHGKPLPHRYLDQMIEQKLERGEWQEVYTNTYGTTSDWDDTWTLIRTRP